MGYLRFARGRQSDDWEVEGDGEGSTSSPFRQKVTAVAASPYETVVATILNAEMTASGYTAGDQIGVPVEFTLTSPGEIVGIRVSGMGEAAGLATIVYEDEPTNAPGDDAAFAGTDGDLILASFVLETVSPSSAVARPHNTTGDSSPKGTRYVGETFWILVAAGESIATPPAGDVTLTVWVKHS